MGKRYKETFTNIEKSKFNTKEFGENKNKKLMSVYAYIKKNSENGVLTKTLNKLHKIYIKWHYKISNKYFYVLVDILIDLNLIEKEYNIIKLVQEKVQTTEDATSVETTTLDSIIENSNSKPLFNTNTPIYNNNDVVAPVEVIISIPEIAKSLGINKKNTIKKIQKMISQKIMKHDISINRPGLEAYLRKAIIEKYKILCYYSKLAYNARREVNNKIINEQESNLNYSGSMDELEAMLLNHY